MRRFGSNLITLTLFCCACNTSGTGEDPPKPSAAPAYPLETSGNQRSLIDSDGQQFLINGDTAWSLMVALTDAEVIQYLDDRHARGFNTILANLIEHRFAPDPPRNVYGAAPFTTPEDIRTPNDAYFDRCVGIVQQALDRDMMAMMTPAYLGIVGGGEGWWQALSARTASEAEAYGAYLGAKFAAFPNIVWVMGGDHFAQEVLSRTRALVTGLKSTGRADWLFTYHAGPNTSSSEVVGDEPWLDLNATYAYEDPGLVAQFEQDYGWTPTRPFFLLESRYEHEPNPPVSRLALRSQAYWSVLTGGMGALFGNNPIWHFENDRPFPNAGTWESNLNGNGSQDRIRFRNLFSTYDWSSLRPDRSRAVLTGGEGSGADAAYAAKSNDSTLVIIYTPSQRALTVNLDALTGSDATVWWFNPRDGSVDAGTPVVSAGSRDFTPPTNDDWVLVIGDAAAGLPPPGIGGDPIDPATSPGAADPSLLAWYEFNGDGGRSLGDSSGNGNDGSCALGSTCPLFVAGDGRPPGCYDFAGNGNYIELPKESAFDFTTEFSLSLWMKSANPRNTWAQLIGKGDSAWSVERQQSTNQVSFTTFAPFPDNMVGATNVFDGQWHHIAAVYDGAQKTLYVDGQVDAQEPYSATVSTNNLNVRLGYNSEYESGQYDGLLDDVRIYDRPLTQSDVLALVVPSAPPLVTLTIPYAGALFTAGQIVEFSADATDSQDGTLPDSAFSWEVRLRNGGSTSTVLALEGARAGSFVVPVTGLDLTGILQYEIRVTVTDSDGLTEVDSVTINPNRVALTFDTVPSGLMLNLDGSQTAAPFTIDSVVGYQHVIDAADAGGAQLFESWSDGEAQVHVINAPASPTSFIATFRLAEIDPRPVAWYEFNGNGGGSVPDSAGNGNDGSCTLGSTCPSFVVADGRPPGAYDFAGDGNYIELSNEWVFDFTTRFSISLWMKSSNPTNTWAQLIGKGDSAWSIERQKSTNQVSFTTFAPSPDNMVGSTNVFDGKWHHIAAVYDGAQKTLYVDGQVDAQEPYTATVSTNNLNVRLGYNSEYTLGQYDGLLDDVRIFSRPLSQAEVQKIGAEATP